MRFVSLSSRARQTFLFRWLSSANARIPASCAIPPPGPDYLKALGREIGDELEFRPQVDGRQLRMKRLSKSAGVKVVRPRAFPW